MPCAVPMRRCWKKRKNKERRRLSSREDDSFFLGHLGNLWNLDIEREDSVEGVIAGSIGLLEQRWLAQSAGCGLSREGDADVEEDCIRDSGAGSPVHSDCCVRYHSTVRLTFAYRRARDADLFHSASGYECERDRQGAA